MANPDSVTNEEAETEAIEKWLRMVDKPLTAKRETERKRSRKLSERTKTVNSPAAGRLQTRSAQDFPSTPAF